MSIDKHYNPDTIVKHLCNITEKQNSDNKIKEMQQKIFARAVELAKNGKRTAPISLEESKLSLEQFGFVVAENLFKKQFLLLWDLEKEKYTDIDKMFTDMKSLYNPKDLEILQIKQLDATEFVFCYKNEFGNENLKDFTITNDDFQKNFISLLKISKSRANKIKQMISNKSEKDFNDFFGSNVYNIPKKDETFVDFTTASRKTWDKIKELANTKFKDDEDNSELLKELTSEISNNFKKFKIEDGVHSFYHKMNKFENKEDNNETLKELTSELSKKFKAFENKIIPLDKKDDESFEELTNDEKKVCDKKECDCIIKVCDKKESDSIDNTVMSKIDSPLECADFFEKINQNKIKDKVEKMQAGKGSFQRIPQQLISEVDDVLNDEVKKLNKEEFEFANSPSFLLNKNKDKVEKMQAGKGSFKRVDPKTTDTIDDAPMIHNWI